MEVRKLCGSLHCKTTNNNKITTDVASNEPKTCEADASASCCSFGQAMVNLQNPSKDDVVKVLESIVAPYTVHRYCNTKRDGNLIFAKAGKEIPGWKNLYDESLSIAVYLNKDKNIEDVYVLDSKTNNIKIYDSQAQLKKTFSAEDRTSLFEYKYYPENFHKYLRLNRMLMPQTETELLKHIDIIDNCFKDKNKVYETNEEKIVYRALPEYLSQVDLNTLSQIGAIYKDNSFVSTTQKLDTAKRFSSGRTPIMEITLPKHSRYLDLDRLFNIDKQRWNEQEFLLKRGSEFLITGYDKENNIIKAQYLNK